MSAKKLQWMIGLVVVLFSGFAKIESEVLFENNQLKVVYSESEGVDYEISKENVSKDNPLSFQIRQFNDNKTFIGSEKIKDVSAETFQRILEKYTDLAVEYQSKNFFNDLGVKKSQIKVVWEKKNNKYRFYYFNAFLVNSYTNGVFDFLRVVDDKTEFVWIDVTVNGEEKVFKKVKVKP